MSGSHPTQGMIHLLELPDGAARMTLPAGRDLAAWHQVLTTEIATHLTPAHAALLATPVRGEAGPAWLAPGTAIRRFGDLDPADRNRLLEAVTVILSDIRRLAEQGIGAVAAAWPALRSVPDLTCLFAVDGRPVLAAWGFAAPAGGAGPLATGDDGVAWRAPAPVAWPVYAGALAALAALALFVGLLLPPLGGLIMPSPNACQAAPGQLALLVEQSREAARADTLRTQLAQLEEDRGQRALQCPIPRQAVAPPPPPPLAPPHADLPEDKWNRHDLAMLEGCWKRYTNMRVHQVDPPHRVFGVLDWEICFGTGGRGHQTVVLNSGARCTNDLMAHFNSDNTLQFDEPGRCRFDRHTGIDLLLRSKAVCHRESDLEASCDMTDVEGPDLGAVKTGRFRRVDAPPP